MKDCQCFCFECICPWNVGQQQVDFFVDEPVDDNVPTSWMQYFIGNPKHFVLGVDGVRKRRDDVKEDVIDL